MAYSTTTWNSGDPITSDLLNKMEVGIAEAHNLVSTATATANQQANRNDTQDSRLSTIDSTLAQINTTLYGTSNSDGLAGNAAKGLKAYLELANTLGTDDSGNYTSSLLTRLTTSETNIGHITEEISLARKGQTSLRGKIDNIDTNIEAASGSIHAIEQIFDTVKVSPRGWGPYDSLKARLDDYENDIAEVRNAHESTVFERTGSNKYGTLDARFEDDEQRIKDIQTEINNAHESTAFNKTGNNKYGSLDARFEAIEDELVGQTNVTTRLDTIEDNVTSLVNNKVNKTDIAINLTTQEAGKVLDATQGRILRETIEAMDTAYKAADTALDGRLDAIDGGNALDTTNGTLAARVGALETEIDMTSANSRIDTALSRIEAMDNSSTGSIAGLDTRIDALETTVNTSTTGLSDRMTAAESAISHAASGADNGGLTERLTVVEGDINTATTGIKARITALETTVDTTTTGLVDRVSSIEDDLDTASTGLKDRVTNLEGKDTIVINTPVSGSNYTNDEPNLSNPSENADYLIADDNGKYFYWRYFGAVTGWQLVGGAGGSGNGSSSGTILAELPAVADGDANIDYFIGNSNDGFVHYRFVEAGPGESAGHYIKILPTDLINDAEVSTVTIDNAADADKWPTTESFSGGLEAYAIDDTSKANNLLADFVAVRNARIQAIYDENEQLQSQKLQVLDTNGKLMEYPIVGGSGGGTTSLYNARVTSSTQTSRSIPSNSTDPVTISAKVIIQQGNTSLGENAVADGVIQYRRRGTTTWNTGNRIEVTADTQEDRYIIPNDTTFIVDVTKYLVEDITIEFRLALVAHPTSNEEDDFDVYSSTFRVTKVNISIADESFDYGSVKNSNFQFNYRCFGSGISKTVHFLLDGTDIVTPVTTTTHNTVLQQVIPMTGKTNGMHTFQVYFVTSTGLESNRLNYYILYNTDTSRQAPLIGAAAENTSITDGDELIVNYSVYTAGSETTDRVEIELYTMDNGTKNSIQTDVLTDVPNNVLIDPPYSTFNYPKVIKTGENDPDPITVYVTLTAYHGQLSDSQTVQVSVGYLHSNYILDAAGENNVIYSYNAYGHSNNESGKESQTYTFTNVSGNSVNITSTFNDFNWSTDGYVDGKCLTIGGGATMSINLPIFNNQMNGISLEENADSADVANQDITKNGRTVEIDYEVQSATNLNAVIMNCMTNIQTTTENGVTTTRANGFQVTPQSCYLLNSSAGIERDESGFILNEDSIAAAYLTPGQRIHLVFVIEPWATDAMRDAAFDGEYHQSTNIYVNGEFANTCPYNRDKVTGNLAGNNFSTNATLTIGNDSCLIKLYSIKIYNRGLTQEQVLQNYKVAPVATRDKLARMEDNDILNNAGEVDYEKARTKYTCLLLTGPAPTNQGGDVVPTISPFKGSPSPAGRRDKKTNEIVGKTESGLTLTKPSNTEANGYTVEFDLQDKIPEDQAAYLGAVGSYCSSNNVQGTSSQKYPLHNLKVYLAKWQPYVPAVYEEQEVEDPETHEVTTEQVEVTPAVSAGIAKVKYSLKGYDSNHKALGTEESTLCWKADYMSTDHANTFNANIADGLFNNRTEDGWPISDWDSKHYQNTVYGIRCLLFQKQGDNPPVFVGDGCLNNDKGNSKTYGLEAKTDDGNDTRSQKWEFTNNSEDLGYFKTDDLMAPMGNSIRAKNGFESCYPDEGDLKDDGLEPNYNHLQILLTWVSKRANYWDETDPQLKSDKKAIFKNEFTKHFNLSHVLTYYLFSQYVALCDNRVKNMFLRSDNVKEEIIRNSTGTVILEGNNNPDALWSNYVDPTTGATTPSYIDWETGEGHSNFAIWEPVLYDLDSCFGVENVGLIKIRYDADWDYEWKGTPQFNGYNSVFWLMVEDSYKDEIATLALSLYNQNPGLNFRTFNQKQIIENQAQISPALTNQDMILKFDKPWSEGFINYAETPDGNGNYPKQTPLYKYLQRGSRAAQKSQFMQQRSMLLSSMYGADEFLNSSIKFRTGVPVGASGNIIGYENASHEVVATQDAEHTIPVYGNGDLTETQITLKANQILYPGVAYGDNKPATRVLTNNGRVAANTSCTIQATSAVQGNDGIFIYGASVLTDIGDISKFKPLQLDVSAGVNLKRLIIGSNAVGYSNNTTNSITGLNKCLLLEEINVRNLKQMATLTLTSNGFIKEVYAAGSGIGTISLPQGGVLETIEYGANTTDITIINQSRLTNFSYENSVNNNYANVTRLWIENTPNVPVKEIITARLTERNSSDSGLRAGGLRIIDIDLDLGSDTTFLELLASDLVKGTKLTANGGHIEGSEDIPTISGKIHISSIRASLLAKLNEMYPDLVIYNRVDGNGTPIMDNVKVEYEVVYKNYNGKVLYTDHRLSDPVENFIDPAYDTNPITNQPYIPIPQKPSDAQYIYKFGEWRNGAYRRFTGWINESTNTLVSGTDTVTGNCELIARYPDISAERRSYTVTWHEEENDGGISSTTVYYGTDLSDDTPPAVTSIKTSNNQTKVFKGWDKPVNKITGDLDVYAKWETSTINANTQNIILENLNAADIAAISRITDNNWKTTHLLPQIGNVIHVPFGHEFDYDSGVNITQLVDLNNKLVLDGTQEYIQVFNNITPLSTNSDWTFAIDYKFLMTSDYFSNGTEFVLASCYQNANSSIQGFKLSVVKSGYSDQVYHEVQVTWGNSNPVTIDYITIKPTTTWGQNNGITIDENAPYLRSYRNMLVLAHNKAAPNELRLYYTAPDISNSTPNEAGYGYGINYGTSFITETKINWETNTISTPIILGGNYYNNTTNIEVNSSGRIPAKGVIYWAKFWDIDLGSNNCQELASWIHETVPFYLTGYNDNLTNNSNLIYSASYNEQSFVSALSFVAAQGLGERKLFAPSNPISVTKNNIIILDQADTTEPMGWKFSIHRLFCQEHLYLGLPTQYKSIIKNSLIKSTSLGSSVENEYSNDYLFLSAAREPSDGQLSLNKWNDEVRYPEWVNPWHWIVPANLTNVFRIVSGRTLTKVNVENNNIYRYRFNGKYITPTTNIYQMENDPTSVTLRYNNADVTIQSGDIWINTNNNIAFVYCTNDEIEEGANVDLISANNRGGWRSSNYWNFRTYHNNVAYRTESLFLAVTDTGVVEITNKRSANAHKGRVVCPGFTV